MVINHKKIIRHIFLIIVFSFTLFTLKEKKEQQLVNKEKYHQILVEAINIEKPNIISKLKQEFNNNDIVGTIKIEGTDIDTVLLQTTNNDYYLEHSPDKSYNNMGSIYLDYRNNYEDQKILIYGHNFRHQDGGFHQLTKYADKAFYDNYPYIELNINNEVAKYQIFSIMVETQKKIYPHMQLSFNTEQKWLNHLSWMKNNSLYNTDVEVRPEDYIITLQTCYYDPAGSYLIINAKKI